MGHDDVMSNAAKPSQREEAWVPDQETLDLARDFFDRSFLPPDLEPLIQGISTGPEIDAALRPARRSEPRQFCQAVIVLRSSRG